VTFTFKKFNTIVLVGQCNTWVSIPSFITPDEATLVPKHVGFLIVINLVCFVHFSTILVLGAAAQRG
jgi:hypothetical protein